MLFGKLTFENWDLKIQNIHIREIEYSGNWIFGKFIIREIDYSENWIFEKVSLFGKLGFGKLKFGKLRFGKLKFGKSNLEFWYVILLAASNPSQDLRRVKSQLKVPKMDVRPNGRKQPLGKIFDFFVVSHRIVAQVFCPMAVFSNWV